MPALDKERLQQDLLHDEDLRLQPYKDSLGFWTIGVGHLIDSRRGGGITRKQAFMILSDDIDAKLRVLDIMWPTWRDFPEPVQRAIANMVFQMGVTEVMSFNNMRRALEEGNWEEAANHGLDSLWARQTPKRAKRVTDLIRSAGKE